MPFEQRPQAIIRLPAMCWWQDKIPQYSYKSKLQHVSVTGTEDHVLETMLVNSKSHLKPSHQLFKTGINFRSEQCSHYTWYCGCTWEQT